METVADVLAQGLRDFGIERVFGIPGGENVEVVDALRQAGIRLVLVHHEASAVFMAHATARLDRQARRLPSPPWGPAPLIR